MTLLRYIIAILASTGCATQAQQPVTTKVKAETKTQSVTVSRQKSDQKDLKEIESRYSKTSGFSAKVKKTLKLKMLEKTREYEGSFEIKKPGMFRLEFATPEKSLALTNGKTIWAVTFPSDPSFDNTVRVMRSNNPERVQSQALLSFLLGHGSLLNEFSIASVKEEGELTRYFLSPKKKRDELQKLELVVSKREKEIRQVRFEDSLENETIMDFSDTKFDLSLKAERFKYIVPKGAEVTEI